MYYIKYLDMFRAILCSSSGGQNCIFTASGIATLCERPYSAPVESGLSSLSTGARSTQRESQVTPPSSIYSFNSRNKIKGLGGSFLKHHKTFDVYWLLNFWSGMIMKVKQPFIEKYNSTLRQPNRAWFGRWMREVSWFQTFAVFYMFYACEDGTDRVFRNVGI
jgi:hypothetical protein